MKADLQAIKGLLMYPRTMRKKYYLASKVPMTLLIKPRILIRLSYYKYNSCFMYCKNCFTDNTEIIPKTREEWTCHRNFRRPKQAASSTHSSLYSLNSFTYSYSGFPKDKSHSQGFSHENIRIMTADESTLQLIQLPGIEVCA